MWASTTEGPVLLVGTAHVIDLAGPLRSTLGTRPLDAVALELDAERASVLLSDSPARPARRAGAPLFLRLWSTLQRRLGEQLGEGAGAEMRAAAQVARERSLPVFLIDDPIRETLGRLMRSMSFRERILLVLGGLVGLVIPAPVVTRQLDQYSESPEAYLEEVRRAYPGVARVLLDDRNERMADRLAELRHRGYGRVAAVVGDAHVSGLAAALRRRGVPVETLKLSELRPPTTP